MLKGGIIDGWGWIKLEITKSLKFKLGLGLVAVMLPLVIFTFYNNINARQVVQEKVSESYLNTLQMFADGVDKNFLQVNEYLYKMETQDTDVGLLKSLPYASDEYMLNKIRIRQKISRDIGFYNIIDTIFIYTPDDLIYATVGNDLINLSILMDKVQEWTELEKSQERQQWHLLEEDRVQGKYFFLRIYKMNIGIYVGAIVTVADIAEPLNALWNQGRIGDTSIYTKSGLLLSQGADAPELKLEAYDLFPAEYTVSKTVMDTETDESYFIIGEASRIVDLFYNISIPEKSMLKNLPFLQKATYFLPVGIVLFLLLFLFFLNEVMFKPLGDIIRGMKRISMGLLDLRIQEGNTTEFNFLANSFNNMATELRTLKIDVYEEQLRVQKAEFKHLQAQISPHFYMNSLNIIYNFAALGDNDSVKRMALHLGDYFRFIMRTNRITVTLQEELKHIDNYIAIQKIRFPNKLEFRVDIDGFTDIEIPALIVQPFVENAIIHGFKNRKQLFSIEVTAESGEADYICKLTVRDNGAGFPDEVLDALKDNLPLGPSDTSRLGITNVIHRLQLHFNNAAKVHLYNCEGGGACIELHIPEKTAATHSDT